MNFFFGLHIFIYLNYFTCFIIYPFRIECLPFSLARADLFIQFGTSRKRSNLHFWKSDPFSDSMYYTSVLSTKTTLFPAKFAIHGHNHGNKACQSTDGIGNRLRNKHTMHAQSKQMRQDQSQRNHDNNLSENREKHRQLQWEKSFCL